MTRKRWCAVLITVLSLAPLEPFGARAAVGGEPTERVRSVVDELYRLASSPATTVEERRQRDVAAAQVMEPLFDWETMARLTLRQHWEKRTPAERDEFTRLFAELFRQAYLTRLSLVDANAFRYEGDTITGEQATVTTQVVTKRGSAIGVAYGLGRAGGRGWRVQDVRVEGISLLDNYRNQFAAIIARSSYEALVERLRTRAREHGSGSSASRPTARQGASGS
jgi:phospholipid transport system substrate-binding protein